MAPMARLHELTKAARPWSAADLARITRALGDEREAARWERFDCPACGRFVEPGSLCLETGARH